MSSIPFHNLFVVIGNPENRRIQFLLKALKMVHSPRVKIVPWIDLLKGRVHLDREIGKNCIVRIDSPGENPLVERQILLNGVDEPDESDNPARISKKQLCNLVFEKGRILFPRQWYLGFRKVLNKINRILLAKQGIKVLQPPKDIEILFDKRLCHAKCSENRISVPKIVTKVNSFDELVEKLRHAKTRRVFIKLANGSSASGVVAFEMNQHRMQAFSSVERIPNGRETRLYNSLKIRCYRSIREIADIVNILCKEGVHIEHWIPKSGWNGHRCDLRIVTVSGLPCHGVLRLSKSPMTNLHLGNKRGNLNELISCMGLSKWSEVKNICRSAASVFPDYHAIGMDILMTPGFQSFFVAELNAFGDLLPEVMFKGLNTYETQIQDLMNQNAF